MAELFCESFEFGFLVIVFFGVFFEFLSQIAVVLSFVGLRYSFLVVVHDLQIVQMLLFVFRLHSERVELVFKAVDVLQQTVVSLLSLQKLDHHLFNV